MPAGVCLNGSSNPDARGTILRRELQHVGRPGSNRTVFMKRSQRRRHRAATPPTRRPLFEELERRRMLATDFGQIAGALNGQLQTMQSAVTSSLNNYHSGAFSNLPF